MKKTLLSSFVILLLSSSILLSQDIDSSRVRITNSGSLVTYKLSEFFNQTILYDIGYSSFSDACSAAVTKGKTLQHTQAWTVTSLTCAANVRSYKGGTITYTGAVNFTGTYDGDATTHFIPSGGGTIAFTTGQELKPEWWGAKADNLSASRTANNNAFSYMAAAGLSYRLSSGIYQMTTSPAWRQGSAVYGTGPRSSIIRPVGGSGWFFDGGSGQLRNITIKDVGFMPDGGATYAVRLRNVYGALLENILIASATEFGVTPIGGATASEAMLDIISEDVTVGNNSNAINLVSVELFSGAGDCMRTTVNGANGTAGLNIQGGEFHGCAGWGITHYGSGVGPNQINIDGTTIEGNTAGSWRIGWCTNCTAKGVHFEASAGSTARHVVTGYNNGIWLGGGVFDSSFGCILADYAIYQGFQMQAIAFERNVFTGCATAAVRLSASGGYAAINVLFTANALTTTPLLWNNTSLSLNVSNICQFGTNTGALNGCVSSNGGVPWAMTGCLNCVADASTIANNIKADYTPMLALQGAPGANVFQNGMCVRVTNLLHDVGPGAANMDLNYSTGSSAGPKPIRKASDPDSAIAGTYKTKGDVTLCWHAAAAAGAAYGVWTAPE